MRAPGALLLIAALVTAATLVAGNAEARRYPELGVLEREAVDAALSSRGLTVDPAPGGKRVRAIHVVNQEVFSERDWAFIRWFNCLHRTTREDVLEREVLLRPGARFDEALLEETERNLRGGDASSVVVLLAVRAPAPSEVDLLVVTRDVWSLRLNSDFDIQGAVLARLAISLSENNLLGWRKRLSLDMTMDQNEAFVGPTYRDPNLRGTRLVLSARARAIFERETGRAEGSSFDFGVAYPLFSLASRWGASVSASSTDRVVRLFRNNQIFRTDLESTPELDNLPFVYRLRSRGVDGSVVRSFGRRVLHRISLSYGLTATRPELRPDFEGTEVQREAFVREKFRFSERVSGVGVGYTTFTPRFVKYRDLGTFDLAEPATLGPTYSMGVFHASPKLGSEHEFFRLTVAAGWAFDLFGGFQSIEAGWTGRAQDGALIDQTTSGAVEAATPVLLRAGRLVARASAAVRRDSLSETPLLLGGSNGLRGYAIGDFDGEARVVAHVEARTRARATFASLRVGGLLFWDGGHAAARFSEASWYDDVGAGLRVLIPQFNAFVFRVDWAFALRSSAHTRAGWPGRASAGFYQLF